MPYSLVLNLITKSPIPLQFLSGRHLYALFLTLVSAVDQELGDRLHDQTTEKAFTLSPLQTIEKNYFYGNSSLEWQYLNAIQPGTRCWWRISLLDDSLFGRLSQLWLNLKPDQPWHLGPADLYITSILGTPQSTQPWANFCNYSTLYEEASDTECQIAFSFCTPTNFRQGNYDTSLPTRECVFNSLLNRWNKYSGIEFSNDFLEVIFPSFFNIRTEIVIDSRSKFIGFIGDINYRILKDVDPLIIKQVNTLADFALYAGVGRKTPMGMGMVRRLHLHKKN